MESLSSYARQFLERINKPDVDFMAGLAPSMAIEQKTQIKNPRSTVGTTTEIYDYLRLLFARIGKIYSPVSNTVVTKDSPESIINELSSIAGAGKVKIYILIELNFISADDFRQKAKELLSKGFYRIISDNNIIDLNDSDDASFRDTEASILKAKENGVLTDRISFDPKDDESVTRLNDSIELAYNESEGFVTVRVFKEDKHYDLKFSRYLEKDGIKFEEPSPRLF